MRILLLVSAYNGLTQRAHVELLDAGHTVTIEIATTDAAMLEAVDKFDPELVLCPYLKHRIPEALWRTRTCIIIHPGIVGDRGPSSLDWAIQEGAAVWGVTALEAAEEMDAGAVWATREFAVPLRTSKASLYRGPVTDAAVQLVHEVVRKRSDATFVPQPLASFENARGTLRPLMKQSDRAIDWQRDTTRAVLVKLRAADSAPGVLDRIGDVEIYLYGGHAEDHLRGVPGTILATREGAICRATVDGAVWITHARRKGTAQETFFKLPATTVLGELGVPELSPDVLPTRDAGTFQDISYEERDEVGMLSFDFYNGAMNTRQCERLCEAMRAAQARPTKVLVLLGGRDFWSNGIHLNVIEASDDPVRASWENINAINDCVESLLANRSQITIAALQGNAGAGGVMMALACDFVVAHGGTVLNPHYKTMGLFGSEYWTYSLTRRVGETVAKSLTESCMPVGAAQALGLGLVDRLVPRSTFVDSVVDYARELARPALFAGILSARTKARDLEIQERPLAEYRAQELEKMRRIFENPNSRYHVERKRFVLKEPQNETPRRLAQHRSGGERRRGPRRDDGLWAA